MVLEIDIKEGLDETNENNENKMIIQKGGEAMHPAAIVGITIGSLIAIPALISLIAFLKARRRIKEIKKEIIKEIEIEMDKIRLEKRKEKHKGHAYNINEDSYETLNTISEWEDNNITINTFKLRESEEYDILRVIVEDIIFLTINDVALSILFEKFKETFESGGEIDSKELNNEIMNKINTEIPRRLYYPCVEKGGKRCAGVKKERNIEIIQATFNSLCNGRDFDSEKIKQFVIDNPKQTENTLWSKDSTDEHTGTGCDIKAVIKEKVGDVICKAVNNIRTMPLEDKIISKLSGGEIKDMNKLDNSINVCKKVLYLRPINFGLNTTVRLTKQAKMGLTSESLGKIKKETCINLIKSIISDIVKKVQSQITESLKDVIDEYKCKGKTFWINNVEQGDDTETMAESYVSTQNLKNKMKGGAVISKGSYGCIFKPAILCSSGKNSKSKKYISKLMINEPFLNEREIRISELIKKIPEYSKRFSPILSLCDIEIKNIKDKDIKKCNDIIRRGKKYQPVIGKVRLINGKDFHENYKRPDKKKFLQILLKSYPILLESLRLLENKYIVHHDLKSNNIIYDEKNNRPVIIDFGLSFSVENIENLKKAFYVEWAPHWTLWPIEIHYLSFVISKKRNMYEDELISLNKEYNESHTVFVKTARLPDVVKNIFSTESYKMLKFYNSKPVNKSIKFIINNYWKTWNNYSLSVTFSMLFLGSIKNVIEINDFNKRFVEILFLNINPNPNLRLSLKKTIEEYKKISLLLNHMDIL